MKTDEVERLLAKFYEGETSISEEQELHRYFVTEQVPEHLLADKEVFSALADHTEIDVPLDLESKLNKSIDQWEETEKKAVKIRHNRKIYWQWMSGIAAGLLLVFGIWTYVDRHESSTTAIADTYTNPEDAYREAQKALALVSLNLNKGMKQVEEAQQKTEKIDKIVKKTINSSRQ